MYLMYRGIEQSYSVMSKTRRNIRHTETALASIGTVERDTGLSKDILRVWERRYGFPTPTRGVKGERVYPPDQLEKLRVIRRLIDSGLRPGDVVAQSMDELSARIRALPESTRRPDGESLVADEALRLLTQHNVTELRQLLLHALMRLGLQRFLTEVVTPLNESIGNAWLEGRLQIFEEHLYAEQMQHLLRQAIGSMAHAGQGPRVLLTTLPGEQHKLGLLMAEACLSAEGAQCISLGTQTPVWDIVEAARAHRVDIVGLSFSQAMAVNAAREGLVDLRKRLPRNIELWAGGKLWARTRKDLPGVTMMASLAAIPAAIQAWREAQACV
jgi:MerR family transcriptional regulator, light-induced transcriptional regulator